MTNNQLTEAELTETLDAATSGYPLTASAEANLRRVFAELQERRKADSEPVAWQIHTPKTGVTYVETNTQSVENVRNGFGSKVEITPLYRHAQPAPVVPDAATAIRACLSEFPESARDIVEECADIAENACRAAMLDNCATVESRNNAGCSPKNGLKCATVLQAEPVTTANKLGNSPVIPDGYVMVPKEPTAEMQSAGASAIRIETTALNKLWTGNAVFRAMLAAAPQEVNSWSSHYLPVTRGDAVGCPFNREVKGE